MSAIHSSQSASSVAITGGKALPEQIQKSFLEVDRIKGQYEKVLSQPAQSLAFEYSLEPFHKVKVITDIILKKGSKPKEPIPGLVKAIKATRDVLMTRKFLSYCTSQHVEKLPETTRQVALDILHGKPNPFEHPRIEEMLGQGSFGKVEKVEVGGKHYALKTLLNSSAKDAQKEMDHEYRELIEHEDRHIMSVAYAEKGKLFLEFVEGGTLGENLSALDPKQTRNVLHQVAQGLSSIHKIGCFHGDIKLDNILLTKDKEVKIADLGRTAPIKEFEEGCKYKGYSYHLPPEFYKGTMLQKDAQKMDVWSFGMLIWHCLRKDSIKVPYALDIPPSEPFTKAFLEKQLDISRCKAIDPCGELMDLMVNCLDQNPAKRPSMYEVQQELEQAKYSRKQRREADSEISTSRRYKI